LRLWVDAQLSPAIAAWIRRTFAGIEASSVRALGLRDAKDREIFEAARTAEAVLVTKDADFLRLLELEGPPPQVIWITCGNTSNERLRSVLAAALPRALDLLGRGEPLVEISDH
jgi:predicted nuclease of predicted toxin-antitoxin system